MIDTYLLVDQCLPDMHVVPRTRRDLARVRKEAIIVNIDPVQDAGLVAVVIMDRFIDAALLHLALGPVREARLWVANIATATRSVVA